MGRYIEYWVMRGEDEIGYIVKDLVFENSKYEFYSAQEIIEIADFLKSILPADRLRKEPVLEFRKEHVPDFGKGAYDRYHVLKYGRGMCDLVRNLTFENDRYDEYEPQDMIEMADFIKERQTGQ